MGVDATAVAYIRSNATVPLVMDCNAQKKRYLSYQQPDTPIVSDDIDTVIDYYIKLSREHNEMDPLDFWRQFSGHFTSRCL